MEDFEEAGDMQGILEIWRTKGPDANLATQICNVLKAGRHFAELEKFLAELPEVTKYQTEEIIRSKIAIAWMRRNYELVYKLIKENSFSNGEDLIEIWDKAHYYEEEQNKGKALTSLARFRIRRRFMPPCSICPSGLRKKATLPKKATRVLKDWFEKNLNDPYPNKDTKFALARQSGLTKLQVTSWFANRRRRPKCAAQFEIRGNASLPEPKTVTSEEPSPTSGEVPVSPPSRPSTPPEARSQQLSKAHSPNTPNNVLLPPLPTRLLGRGQGFPLPAPQVYAFEPAPQMMDQDACVVHCKVENGAAFVNQPFFPFTLPEHAQFFLPHAPPFPIVNVCRREENQSCARNRQQLQPCSHVTDPNVHAAHNSSHVTYPAEHVTYFNPRVPHLSSHVTHASPTITYSSLHGLHPGTHVARTDPYVNTNPCVTYPSPRVTPTSPCVTLPSAHVCPPNGHAYAGLHAAKILMDMSNTFTM